VIRADRLSGDITLDAGLLEGLLRCRGMGFLAGHRPSLWNDPPSGIPGREQQDLGLSVSSLPVGEHAELRGPFAIRLTH
jgi:hypothetical protein